HELGRDLAVALVASFHPAVLDLDGATLDPAELVQPLHHGGDHVALRRRRAHTHEADGRQPPPLLCARRERPRNARRRRAAKQRDERAPPHSITSSARASSVGGTSMPSALAVLRLIASWNLVGCSTGRSAGFSPLRMRPT